MSKIPSEYAPTQMDSDLDRLCTSLVPGGTPILVPIRPWNKALPAECYMNVDNYIKSHGGQRVLGWRLMRWANIIVECEAHAVWKSDSGEFLDITPYSQNASLFLPDSTLCCDGHRIANRRLPLTNSPLIARLMEFWTTLDTYTETIPINQPVAVSESFLVQMESAMYPLSFDVGRNDPCPCQSGLKFKKCCGRFTHP